MNRHYDNLKLTELRYFGLYLLNGDMPTPGDRMLTEQELEEEAYRPMERLISETLLDTNAADAVLEAATAYGEACERIGYFSGMKTGARLLLNLIGDEPILY